MKRMKDISGKVSMVVDFSHMIGKIKESSLVGKPVTMRGLRIGEIVDYTLSDNSLNVRVEMDKEIAGIMFDTGKVLTCEVKGNE